MRALTIVAALAHFAAPRIAACQPNVSGQRLFGTFGYHQARIDTSLDLPGAKSRDSGAVLGTD